MNLGKPFVLVVSLRILLVVFLHAQAFKVSPEHMAVLEVVVHGPFVVGTWFLEHFIENAPAGGSSRFLTISSGDKVVGQGLLFALLILLLLVPLRASAGAHGILFLALPFVLVAAKDGTNRLLAGDEVGDDVHQTFGSDGSAVT
jgi:hypothetical protein